MFTVNFKVCIEVSTRPVPWFVLNCGYAIGRVSIQANENINE
jgi:hypothetical protein